MKKKTKIIATIGPASNHKNTISDMIKNGMNVARLNFSHGSHSEHKKIIDYLRELPLSKNHVAILQDIAGPKIRIGEIDNESVFLKKGDNFILTERKITGNKHIVTVNLPGFSECVQINDVILLNDGIVELIVESINGKDVVCKIENEGPVSSRKGISLPSRSENIKLLSDKDIKDIKFGIENNVDYIAVSFVRNADDINEVKELLNKNNAHIKIIAKIEKPEAVKNFDEILNVSDGIMIARGDLGVEISFEKVPHIQKLLINKTRNACKPVITATQMLASMTENLRPSRAEVTDVANAIIDGTDALMLSEETAVGHNPVLAVKTMTKIACETEANIPYIHSALIDEDYSADLHVAQNACQLANGTNSQIIFCFTMSGSTARKVARFRQDIPVIALTQNIKTCRELSLSWGVEPIKIPPIENLEEVISAAKNIVINNDSFNYVNSFVITCGIPFNKSGNTNLCGVFNIK